jgi:hypothetical protein
MMAENSVLPAREKSMPINNKPIEFTFTGLYGLDEQLQQLREHISRINQVIEHQKESIRYIRPSPVLIHGASGMKDLEDCSRIVFD